MMKRCKTRSCSNQDKNFELIPLELIIDIFSRLTAKSIARFRCVSKLWDSRIRSQNFTESFFLLSLSRPKLLFTCLKDGKTFFFSAPQSQNSSPLTATSHMSFPVNYFCGNSRPVRGLVCGLNQQDINGRRVTMPMICNPSTGQSLSLRRVKTRRTKVFSYLGYDPIDKQFKVLCMTELLAKARRYLAAEHQVLTLGVGKKRPSWRLIECDIPHSPDIYGCGDYDGICINGVLYYLAYVYKDNRLLSYSYDVVCFDIRSEKFKSITIAEGMRKEYMSNLSTLVDHKGKLAMLVLRPDCSYSTKDIKNIELWVLEDPKINQWLSYIYDLSPVRAAWMKKFIETEVRFVGTADTGEIVLSLTERWGSFYIVYLNIEKNSITRVEIQGLEKFKNQQVYAFLDHVEDLKLMASV